MPGAPVPRLAFAGTASPEGLEPALCGAFSRLVAPVALLPIAGRVPLDGQGFVPSTGWPLLMTLPGPEPSQLRSAVRTRRTVELSEAAGVQAANAVIAAAKIKICFSRKIFTIAPALPSWGAALSAPASRSSAPLEFQLHGF